MMFEIMLQNNTSWILANSKYHSPDVYLPVSPRIVYLSHIFISLKNTTQNT